jgi:hypothetical protein
MRCDDAGSAAVARAPAPEAEADMPPASKAETATDGAVPQLRGEASDIQMAMPLGAAATGGACESVIMSFSVCALEPATRGVPRLQAGRAYTLRVPGAYKVDTTFQLDGVTTACSTVTFGTLTLAAGVTAVERCLIPTADVALRITVPSGDPQVWMSNAVLAEVCQGCD